MVHRCIDAVPAWIRFRIQPDQTNQNPNATDVPELRPFLCCSCQSLKSKQVSAFSTVSSRIEPEHTRAAGTLCYDQQ